MALLITCPKCRLEGQLPDDDPGGIIACPRCGMEFTPPAIAPPESDFGDDPDGLAVWVGAGVSANVTPPPMRGLSPDILAGPPIAPPPVTITPENASQHADWLQMEVARFNAHVARQLETIRKSREDLAGHEARAAAALVTREMELNRDRAELASRATALDRREEQLAAEREQLARRAEDLDRMELAIQRRLEEVDELEETLRKELEDREAEVERQRRTIEEALQASRANRPAS